MFAFIARQPILDKSKSVFAYELLFRDGKSGAYPEHNEEKANIFLSTSIHLGLMISAAKKRLLSRSRQIQLFRASCIA